MPTSKVLTQGLVRKFYISNVAANGELDALTLPQQNQIISKLTVCVSICVTLLHGGSRNEETRSITNRVFNVEQTAETQEHR